MHIWYEELGRENNNSVSIFPTEDEPDLCKSSASTATPDLSRGQYLVCSAGLKSLRDPAFAQVQYGCGSLPWFHPSAGDRPYQTIGLTWKLSFWKSKTSHQRSTALGWMSLSLQLLLLRGTFRCWRELSSFPTRRSPSDTLLDVDGSVCSSYLPSPEPFFFFFLSVFFQGCISSANPSFPYPTWVQPALLLTGHAHTPASCPKLNCTRWTIPQNYMHRPWARGFRCLLFLPPLVREKFKIRAKKAAVTFESFFSFHHSANA